VRVSAPIYAEESVMEKAGIVASPEIRATTPAEAEKLEAFRDFVDTLDLDDLGG
jgi:bifunctional DNase/RNase